MKIFSIVFLISSWPLSESRGVNGGLECAVCTISLGITNQLAEIHNETVVAASLRLCGVMKPPLSDTCTKLVRILEPILIDSLFPKVITPDILCYSLGVCHTDRGNGYCHLFPKPNGSFHKTVEQVKHRLRFFDHPNSFKELSSKLQYNLCNLPGFEKICEVLLEGWMEMAPAFDADNDMFSPMKTARGSHWRGRDCYDGDRDSYPGRKAVLGDKLKDSNCNGIWGVDQITGLTWEEKLCNNSDSRGLIVLGDSVSAHFHFPEAWFNPIFISEKTLHNVTDHFMDELDWPHLGFVTGYENTTEPFLIKGKTDSLYWRLRFRNRCNHRDYQNVCRNGASSADLMTYVENVARNISNDKPTILLYAAVGNDVCNSYRKTIENMTTPLNFRNNVVHVLERLQTLLPNGSHVLLIGLVDGAFIYPTMAERLHPLGKLRGDVHYKDVYQWFTCMEIGPCVGWMTPNETLRHFTSQRAKELNEVLKKIPYHYKFSNFDVYYLQNPFHKVLHEWKLKGKPLWQLIDQVDSLHPSQMAQSLIAEALWNDIFSNHPHVLGKINSHNNDIQRLFGDQGGH